MTEVQIRTSPSRSSKSRSPSIGPGGGSPRGNRKITVIDGAFQSQKASSPSSSEKVGNTSSPSSRASSLVQHHSRSYTAISSSHPHHLVSPSHDSYSSLRSRSRTISDRTSASSDNLDSVVSNGDDLALFRPQSNHQDPYFPPSSPLSWRSSSSSSLTDSSVTGLVQHPSSEKSILKDIKKEMARNMRRTKDLERQARLVPKLREDLGSFNSERKKLLNELLEERAVVMQLKQRVILLHEQNHQLAQLARSSSTSGGGSSQVLAIRNTLVATLAQLSQMEDQVQAIPGLRSQLREMMDENSWLKERQKQVVVRLPSDLPEGVSPTDYHSLTEENTRLKESNHQLVEEMKVISQHLKAVSDSCDSLQCRMERLHSTQVQTQPFHECIKKLELEKETLYQELVDARFNHEYVADVDKAHLVKKVASLRKTNYKLNAKMESLKQEARQQKEQLVIKLFEVETLNIKTSQHELEKHLLGVEQDQLRSTSSSPELLLDHFDEDDMELREASPETHAQLLRFKQLEIHSQEFQNVLKVLMVDKQELEKRVADMGAMIEEKHITDLEHQLQESQSKLELSRERIKILENELQTSASTSSDDTSSSKRNSLKEQVTDLQKQLKKMSYIEQDTTGRNQHQDPELELLRQSCDRLCTEKRRLEKKHREGRNKLKTVAEDLAKSAKLVKNYQEQCLSLQSELEKTREEMSSLYKDHASVKAQLQVSEVEHQSSVKQAVEEASSQMVKHLEEKYQQVSTELSTVRELHRGSQKELESKNCRIEELLGQLDTASVSSGTLEVQNQTLQKRVTEMEVSLEDSHQRMQMLEQELKSLSEKAKRVGGLESQHSVLQFSLSQREEELQALQTEASSLKETVSELSSQNKSLQQKVDMLSQKTPALMQQTTELKVAKDEAERKFSSLRVEQETSRTTIAELQLKLQSSERFCQELRAKLDLLQSDLDHAESHLDKANTELQRERQKSTDEQRKQAIMEEEFAVSTIEAKQQHTSLSNKAQRLEQQLKEATQSLERERDCCRSSENKLSQIQSEEVPKLRSDLAETVTKMSQVTADYSARLAHIRQLEILLQESQSQSQEMSHRLLTAEKELSHSAQKTSSVTIELQRREKELCDLKATHSMTLLQSQKLSQDMSELRKEVSCLQDKLDNQGDIHSQVCLGLKQECQQLQLELKTSQRRTAEIERTLQKSAQDLHNSSDELARKTTETEELRKKVEHLSNHCEALTATRENLMRRLDK